MTERALFATFNKVKKYNQEIVLVIFCIGLFVYSIGLVHIGSIKVKSLFYIGGIIFFVFNYKLFSRADFKALIFPLACFLLLLFLGVLTYFDDVMHYGFVRTLQKVNSHIFSYIALFLIAYFFVLYAKDSVVKYLLCFVGFVCAINIIAMIYLSITNGLNLYGNTPFFHASVAQITLWVCFAIGASIAGVIVCNGGGRYLFIILLGLCFIGLLSNPERSYMLAFIVMILTPFIVMKYKYKKPIVLGLLALFVILMGCFYHYSKYLPSRYNIAQVIDTFHIVWDTPPIAMGQYDKVCFGKKAFDCSLESVQNGKSDITWDHSIVSRLAMYKSAFHIISEHPFTPRVIGMWNTGLYLREYYSPNDPYRVYLDTYIIDRSPMYYGYQHVHSLPLSFAIEFGLFGLLAYVGLCVYIILCGLRLREEAHPYFRGGGLCLVVAMMGLLTSTLFDVLYVNHLMNIMLVVGFLVGFCMKRLRETNKGKFTQ